MKAETSRPVESMTHLSRILPWLRNDTTGGNTADTGHLSPSLSGQAKVQMTDETQNA